MARQWWLFQLVLFVRFCGEFLFGQFSAASPPSAGLFALGVADGIYSWRSQGIDSGEYSRGLLREVRELVQAGYTDVLSSATLL